MFRLVVAVLALAVLPAIHASLAFQERQLTVTPKAGHSSFLWVGKTDNLGRNSQTLTRSATVYLGASPDTLMATKRALQSEDVNHGAT